VNTTPPIVSTKRQIGNTRSIPATGHHPDIELRSG
jgi:hypothetical protein